MVQTFVGLTTKIQKSSQPYPFVTSSNLSARLRRPTIAASTSCFIIKSSFLRFTFSTYCISMASIFHFLLLFSFFLPQISSSTPYLFLPITKDPATLQYLAQILHGNQLLPTNLVVDLGGPFIWIDCASSSSRRQVPSLSLQCSAAKTGKSYGGKCEVLLENRVAEMGIRGDLVEDAIAVGDITIAQYFLHSCAPTTLLKGLASGAKGMIGLGRTRISLPSQIAGKNGGDRKFTLCLSASDGGIFFGNGRTDSIISKSLMYTPLITNPNYHDYYIIMKSIKINGKRLSINKSLLTLDQEQNGGTKLSTIAPYTTMESTIYATFSEAYMKAALAMNMSRAASVEPFELCFRSGWSSTEAAPAVDLVLQSEMVVWRIDGGNAMVRVSEEVRCLGLLDGGLKAGASVVIGGLQMEEMLLEFDLGRSVLGFSSSLLTKETTCSNLILDSTFLESL